MNIQVQCCGIILLLLLIGLFFKDRRLGLYQEHAFLKVAVCTLVSIVLDISTIIAITYREFLPVLFLDLLCKTYNSSLICIGYLALNYAFTGIYSKKVLKSILFKYRAFTLVACVIVFILPIDYYHEGRSVYTLDGSVQATYLFAVLFFMETAYHVIHYRRIISRKRRYAISAWLAVWVIASGIQFFNNELLLVGFASAVGVSILFYLLENPEANIDRQFGCFNSNAFMDFMKQDFEDKQSYGLIVVSFTYLHDKNLLGGEVCAAIQILSDAFMKNKKIRVFKTIEAKLVIATEDKNLLKDTVEQLKENKIENGKGETVSLEIKPHVYVMEDSRLVSDENELLGVLRNHILQQHMNEQDRITYIDEKIVEEVRNKEKVRTLILDAIRMDRIEVFYQPIFSNGDQKFAHAEALARIRKEDGSIVMPGVFIEVAEEYGLIRQLGKIVFEKTCQLIQEKHLHDLGVKSIAVNLSVVQCENQKLAEDYISILDKYELQPSSINLEITETAAIKTETAIQDNMGKLIGHGVSFSLDDFGDGHSNLNYITDMPFENIKLDLKLVKRYFQSDKAKLILKSVVKMIHDMDLKVVAEGVETKEELEAMTGIGVDYIQGYYFSKPLCVDDYITFLKKHSK